MRRPPATALRTWYPVDEGKEIGGFGIILGRPAQGAPHQMQSNLKPRSTYPYPDALHPGNDSKDGRFSPKAVAVQSNLPGPEIAACARMEGAQSASRPAQRWPWQAAYLSIQAGLWRQRAGAAGQPSPGTPEACRLRHRLSIKEVPRCDAALTPYPGASRGTWDGCADTAYGARNKRAGLVLAGNSINCSVTLP